MKLIDLAVRDKKAIDSIVKQVKALVKKGSIHWGRDLEITNEGRLYTIIVDNEGKLGNDIAGIVGRNQFAICKSIKEYDGDYDWAADAYLRPVSIVTFVMT